jgi:hypothetical protein
MNLAALILPLVSPSAPPVTVQLRAYETTSSIAFNGAYLVKSPEYRGNATLLFDPSSPTEAELEELVKKGEIKFFGNPVVRTLSGTEGAIKTIHEEIVDSKAATFEQSFTVRPLVDKNGNVSITLGALLKRTGDAPKELLNSHATFSLREGKTVYFLAPMKQDRKHSLLVSVRVSKGS